MAQNNRKKPPSFASIYTYRSSSTSPFCRITGKSHSMDEHHYVPSPDDFPKFDNICGCRITEKNHHFKDYKYVYPIIDLDGVTRMVTEHDFHCRITAKYKAMAGHKYLYPLLGSTTDKTVNDMVSVVEDESMHDVLVPSEVELIVRGGIQDVLKLKDNENLFIQSKEGAVFPAALKEIYKRKEAVRVRRHTLPISLEAAIASDLKEVSTPTIKLLKDIKKELEKPPEPEKMDITVSETDTFDMIPEDVEILKDVRKSRPKRPGRHKNKENETPNKKKMKKDVFDQKPVNSESNTDVSNQPVLPDVAKEEPKVLKEEPQRLSRLDRYKMQFQNFEKKSTVSGGSRLTLVGAYDKDEEEELDFSESVEIQYIQSTVSMENRAVITSDIPAVNPSSACLGYSSADTEMEMSENIINNNKSSSVSVLSDVEEEDSPPKSFKDLKSFIGSKLNFDKALKYQSKQIVHSHDVANKEVTVDNRTQISDKLISNVSGEIQQNSDKIVEVKVPLSETKQKVESGETREIPVPATKIDSGSTIKEDHNQTSISVPCENENSKNTQRLKDSVLNGTYTKISEIYCREEEELTKHDNMNLQSSFASWKSVDNLNMLDDLEENNKMTIQNEMLDISMKESDASSETVEIPRNVHLRRVIDMNNIDDSSKIHSLESSCSKSINNTEELISKKRENFMSHVSQSNKIFNPETVTAKTIIVDRDSFVTHDVAIHENATHFNEGKTNEMQVSIISDSSVIKTSRISSNGENMNSDVAKQHLKSVNVNSRSEKGEYNMCNGNLKSNMRTKYMESNVCNGKEDSSKAQKDIWTSNDVQNVKKVDYGYENNLSEKFVSNTSNSQKFINSEEDISLKENVFPQKKKCLTQGDKSENGVKEESKQMINKTKISNVNGFCAEMEANKEYISNKELPSVTKVDSEDHKRLLNGYGENIQHLSHLNADKYSSVNGDVVNIESTYNVATEDQGKKPFECSNLESKNAEVSEKHFHDSLINKTNNSLSTKSNTESIQERCSSLNTKVVDNEIKLNKLKDNGSPIYKTTNDLTEPSECHFLLPSEEYSFDFSSSVLQNFELRLPITCSLLKKEKLFSAKCEQTGICSPCVGTCASMPLDRIETKGHAKWNTACLQVRSL